MKADVTRPDGTTIRIRGSRKEVVAALVALAEAPARGYPYYRSVPGITWSSTDADDTNVFNISGTVIS